MGEPQRRPDKRVIVDALVLAFSHSEIRSVVGTDALRSVLDVEYKDMMTGSTFSLEQLWDLLKSQPGFNPEAAVPPMCLFKTWESRLGIEVQLPEEIAGMRLADQTARASVCRVPTQELRRVINDSEPARPAIKTTGRHKGVQGRPASGRIPEQADGLAGRLSPERRRLVLIAATAIAVVGFTFAGLSVWRAVMVDAKWEDMSASAIAGELPISDPERLGNEVGATLTDPGWLARPQAEREAQLQVALEGLRSRDVRVLFLRLDGKVRAAAEVGSGGAIRYRFY